MYKLKVGRSWSDSPKFDFIYPEGHLEDAICFIDTLFAHEDHENLEISITHEKEKEENER